jgi:molybdopterin-biosynthesis enzyme MoeA-like protein
LSGKFADENAVFLIGELRELGVDLKRIAVIPDELSEIAATVRGMSERFEHVFTSGGVGPTHDDLTMQGVALGFGVELVHLDGLIELLGAFYGPDLTPAQRRLAEAPAGAELVYGTDPAWPVVRFRNVYIFPGVPALFRRKFNAIKETFRGQPMICVQVHMRSDETAVAAELVVLDLAHPDVAIGSYPRFEERPRLIITVEGRDRSAVDAAVAAIREAFADKLIDP